MAGIKLITQGKIFDDNYPEIHLKSLWAQMRISSNGFLYSLMPLNIQTINSLAFINKIFFTY